MEKTVILNPNIYIDDIFDKYPDAELFQFSDGDYFLSKILKINKSNITFIGLSNDPSKVHIYQKNENYDGFDIEYLDRFIMKNISLHVTSPNKVAIVMANVNNTIISDCYFYGNPTTFTIFYAGPDMIQGSDTINKYNNNILDKNNKFMNNVIYADWSGDTISCSLQKNFLFRKNIIRGGKVAIYMCKNSFFNKNIINDSSTNGFYISLPSHHIFVNNNKIYEPQNSAITIKNQIEHGTFDETPYNIHIKSNFVYDSKFYSFEINNGNNIYLDKNISLRTKNIVFYMYNSKNIFISNNDVYYYEYGMYLENSSNIKGRYNKFVNYFPVDALSFIKFVNSSDNDFSYNKLVGKITNNIINEHNSSNNTIYKTEYNMYTTYNDDDIYFKIK